MKFSEILNLITVGAVIFAAIQIYINRKQLYLSTITKCIADFRDLKGLHRETVKKKTLFKYIDITNEELFYFKHNYLPKKVAIEWIDGMIEFIPITKGKSVINSNFCVKEFVVKQSYYFSNYPRIINAFSVKGYYNVELIYNRAHPNINKRMKERRKLINEIITNNNNFKYFD